MDCIPIVSQFKSIVQCTLGNWDAARDTQENFSKQCIICSQVRWAVETVQGDEKAAQNTSEAFYDSTDGFLKKTPILGHARGCLAYLSGDKQTGDETIVQATKTTVGMVLVGLFLHGGFLIGSGIAIVGQRIKEVDAPPQEIVTAPRMKRVATTHAALHRLDMLDRTFDIFNPAFFALPEITFFTSEATVPSHSELGDSDFDFMKLIQHPVEAEKERDGTEKACLQSQEIRGRKTVRLANSEREKGCRARSSSLECRQRLQEWRQSMVTPRL
jgi:hypothetical protein